MWREGLIGFYGILENKKGWKNHPARKEFENCPDKLWQRLKLVRQEAVKRGFNFKELPQSPPTTKNHPCEWQSYEEQIKRLKSKRKTIKSCKCKI